MLQAIPVRERHCTHAGRSASSADARAGGGTVRSASHMSGSLKHSSLPVAAIVGGKKTGITRHRV